MDTATNKTKNTTQKCSNQTKNRSHRSSKNGKSKNNLTLEATAKSSSCKKVSSVHSQKNEPEDTSIQLITRRAPAQKYANFEEYMKARTHDQKA